MSVPERVLSRIWKVLYRHVQTSTVKIRAVENRIFCHFHVQSTAEIIIKKQFVLLPTLGSSVSECMQGAKFCLEGKNCFNFDNCLLWLSGILICE